MEIREGFARTFAQEKGLPFNETLCLADKGFSAYHSKHKSKGDLGRFLEMVKNSEIAEGSYLVVENIDRLSREEMLDAIETIIFGLIKHCINVVTPDRTIYSRNSINKDIWRLIAHIERAHEESESKSIRIRAAREIARKLAREERKILTGRCPAWLKVVKVEGKKSEFEIIPGAKETISKIFDLKLKGIGKGLIAKKLNSESKWKPPVNENGKGGKWSESYIQKILQNRAVIGEYQPYQINGKGKREHSGEPIQRYFPQVIEDNVFYAVQEHLKQNKGKGGRTGKVSNLFRHLVKCPYCGGSMAFVNKGKPPKGGSYLVCSNGRLGLGCGWHSIRYDECQKTILENCKGLNPEQVLPSKDERMKLCYTLTQRIQGKTAELRDIEQRIENYDDQIGRTKDSGRRDKYESLILELEQQKKDIAKQIEDDEKELRKAQSALQSFAKWQKDLVALQKGISADNIELRIRLQHHLRGLIEKIEVFTVGFKELYNEDKDKDEKPQRKLIKWKAMTKGEKDVHRKPGYFNSTETIVDYVYDVVGEASPKLVRSKAFGNFVKDLTTRRMSKEGRFLRIHFKTGTWIDAIPEGSIASGSKMFIDDEGKLCYKLVGPDIGRLWKEYEKKHSKAG